MSYDATIDTIQTVALLGVMAVLSYLLHAIVKALDEVKARLNVLEREQGDD